MENNQDTFEKIEQYLDGTLKGEALSSFEKAMKNDPDLFAEVDLHRMMTVAIADEKKDKAIAKKLKSAGKAYLETRSTSNGTATKRIRMKPMNWAVAASFALLIALASWFYWNGTSTLSGSELFAQEFEVPLLTDRQRSSTDDFNVILDKAYSSYEANNFNEAVIAFEAALAKEELVSLRYYQGVSFLASSPPDHQKAINAFESIISDGNSSFVNASKWFLALTHLQSGKKEKALPLLEQLSQVPSKYQQRSKDLLKKL